MKKIVFALTAILAVAACNKSTSISDIESEQTYKHLEIDITVNSADTKAVKTAWETGDQVLIFFDKEIASTPRYLVMEYNGTTWVPNFNEGTLEAELLGKASGTLSAVYTPFARSWEVNKINDTKYQVYPKDATDHVIYYYYLKDSNRAYTVSAGKLTATISLSTDDDLIHFFIPETVGESEQYIINGFDPSFMEGYMLNNFNDDGSFSSFDYGLMGYPYNGGLVFCGKKTVLYDSIPAGSYIDVFDYSITSKQYRLTLTSDKSIVAGSNIVLPALSSARWEVTDL